MLSLIPQKVVAIRVFGAACPDSCQTLKINLKEVEGHGVLGVFHPT